MDKYSLCTNQLVGYTSNSQKARLMTEPWVAKNIICPACGSALASFPNNQKVADLYCTSCREEFELKSGQALPTTRIVNGAYHTMMKRLTAVNNPNLLFLHYNQLEVKSLLLVPRFFFIPECIEPRKPLSQKAKRAGWQGCNIRLDQIPESGRIWLIRDQKELPQQIIQQQWLHDIKRLDGITPSNRSWKLGVQQILDTLSVEFTLTQVYAYESTLRRRFPNNQHIPAKIRQQLQILRDSGDIEFLGQGRYRKMLL